MRKVYRARWENIRRLDQEPSGKPETTVGGDSNCLCYWGFPGEVYRAVTRATVRREVSSVGKGMPLNMEMKDRTMLSQPG